MGDVASPDDLARALAGMDTAVHLAATPDDADFLTRAPAEQRGRASTMCSRRRADAASGASSW